MKKILLSLVAMIISLSTFAAKYTHEFASGELPKAGGEVTLSNVTWTATEATYIGWDQNYGKGIQIGSSSKPTSSFSLKTDGIKGKITKITVNSAIAKDGDAKLTISVGGTEYLENAELQLEKGDYSCEPNEEGEIEISFAATAKAFYIASITVEYESASTKKETTVEFAGKTSFDVFVGESFPFPQAYVKDGDDILDNLTVTYAVDNEELAKIEEGTDGTPVVKILAPGKFKITASFAGNDTYEASSAVCSFTAMKKYESIAALLEDEPTGQTVCVVLNNAKITDFYIYNEAKAGIYVNDGTGDVLIYCKNVPEEWVAEGTVSGRLICPWKDYKGTKELCPTSWDQLTYDVPTGIATIKAAQKTTAIFNAAGQLLSAPQKGLNIIDGKKVFVK